MTGFEVAESSDQRHVKGMKSEESCTSGSSSRSDPLATLYGEMVLSEFEKTPHEFLPRDKFDQVLREVDSQKPRDAVLLLMKLEPDRATEDERSLADYILKSAKTVFSIAFYIGLNKQLSTAMELFKEGDFKDAALPIAEWPKAKLKKPWVNDHPFAVMENRQGQKANPIWTLVSIDLFQREQWRFLAPIISTKSRDHNFGQHIIPFTKKGKKPSSGAHGIVCEYTIHPGHFEDESQPDRPPNTIVAVKAFRQSHEKVALDWGREVEALAKMNELRQSHIVRFITAFQRGKQDDMEHYVIFEWADGGNLGDFWRFWDEQPGPRLTPSTMWWVVKQFHGLAQALKSAHYLAGGASYRHGDLKPANILWFREPGGYGQLKIGDWGEAKSHKQVTALRHNTTAKFGTRRYEPPETGLQSSLPPEDRHVRSRLYDIWGIGCIALEFIIWLLYGQKGLARFNSSNQGDYGISEMFYEVSPNRTAKIHRVVTHWMDHMAKDPLCRVSETALGSLLQVVRTGLLVVDLPDGGGADPQAHCDQSSSTHTTSPPGGTHIPIPSMDRGGMTATETPPTVSIEITQADTTDSVTDNVPNWSETRFRATELETKLREIMNAKRAEVYWYQALKPKPSPVDSGGSSYLSVSTKSIARNTNTKSTGRLVDDYGHPVLDPEDWTFIVDNDFAAILMSELEKANKSPTQRTSLTTRLCRRCMDFREQLLNANFESTYNPHTLQQNADAKTCELCCLLWQAYKDNKTEDVETIRFWRDRSTLKMNGAKHPVLTLFRRNDPRSQAPDVQIGFAELPEAGQEQHLGILRGWLDDCDSKHFEPTCKPSGCNQQHQSVTGGPTTQLPARLIDVGLDEDVIVKLKEMRTRDTGDWLALSYRWGALPHFSTTRQNLSDHMAGMKLASLPRTFRDAIKVTRALGKKYLWIDSICIIQGENGDFNRESKRMEDVYSGAYCVLAASSAADQRSGFLRHRKGRKHVALSPRNGGSDILYVCQLIENFREHVLQGALNKRGWVLQEHALARRTIFFTEHQTYWECGHGVRCETMATMSNESAALLGDPDFPRILNPAKHGERILRFQELYQQYSRLDLSSESDRPTAIDGVQQRLLRTMGVKGGFGVFDDYKNRGLLRRSLLWHRGEGTKSLKRIKFPTDPEKVPSWSWMAFSGGIDYFSLNFLGFHWQDIQSPWSTLTGAAPSNAFIAQVQALDRSAAGESEYKVVFDDPTEIKPDLPMAILLGIEKGLRPATDRIHYILVVKAKKASDLGSNTHYKRIGAGYVPGRCLKGDPTSCFLL